MTCLEIPPIGYRIMAKSGHHAITPEEIASRSKLSRSTVQRISSLNRWDPVKVGVMKAFIHGCGFDVDHPPIRQWNTICERGLSSVKHLQLRKRARFSECGTMANKIKFITRTILK
jgi:hypothetical protein